MYGPSEDGAYKFNPSLPLKHAMAISVPSINDWHAALGYPVRQTVSSIIKNFRLPCSSDGFRLCSSCRLGKLAKIPLASVEHHSIAPFQIIHTDIGVQLLYYLLWVIIMSLFLLIIILGSVGFIF
jgi:hypothetical protein